MPDTTTERADKVMLPTELEEIMKRHASAEPGWCLERGRDDSYRFAIEGDGPTHIATFDGNDGSTPSYTTEENALFAVNAYWDVPRLVAEVRRLQTALNEGANTTDPVKILRLAVEQMRTNATHMQELLDKTEKERDEAQKSARWLREQQLPTAQRDAAYQKEGKERWRDRALKAEAALKAKGGGDDA